MNQPQELSLAEIRKYMLKNNGKVTNHVLVKYFKKFLTDPITQNEARKNFKTFVNILATSKTEGKEKYLLLRKRYYNECPSEDNISNTSVTSSSVAPMSPGSRSAISESGDSPLRIPPPYRPPPVVTSPTVAGLPELQSTNAQYRDCVHEFKNAISALKSSEFRQEGVEISDESPLLPPRKRNSIEKSNSEDSIVKSNSKDSIVKSPSGDEIPQKINSIREDNKDVSSDLVVVAGDDGDSENKLSVKEAMRKFNRIASEEEAKVTSPPGKIKKSEKRNDDKENMANVEVALITHPKAKEWIVSAARANFQELAKLSSEYPELVRLQDPSTTALHWAAKHGNEDVVKLIAGKHNCNVNMQTNGGYTPLHIAMQFEKDNIFTLLWNVYKADRDLVDYSGKKSLDYRKQKTTVSASTYSKIKAKKQHSEKEKDLGFLRIGSLNVRVKKTTEAFSNFLGVGSGSDRSHTHSSSSYNQSRVPLNVRTSAPPNSNHFDQIHKTWGSADNIPHNKIAGGNHAGSSIMPPPKYGAAAKKNRSKRAAEFGVNINRTHSQSVPSTPNQLRAPISGIARHDIGDSDSDSAYGFDSNWNETKDGPQKPTYI